MSYATQNAVINLLQADTVLTELLAEDPNAAGRPAIFAANKNQSPPVYASLTLRLESELPNNLFRSGVARSPGAAQTEEQISDEYFDIEVWSNAPSPASIYTISARLDANLHQTAFATSSGEAFWSERVFAQPDLFDDTLRVWYGLFRYRIRVSRPPTT